ncbi:MAG: hypothetical protein K8T91_10930 [Planctomycetes bacterium]|nr:hypothetical protein [Planctomycetota bacterium]
MHTLTIASLALALVLAVIALIHQVRLRHALEKLLKLIFKKWRQDEEERQRFVDHGRRGGSGRRNRRMRQ